MLILRTNIAYVVLITTKVTDHCYGIGVKGQIYLEYVLLLVIRTPPVLLTEVVPILYNDCHYVLRVKRQMYKKSSCLASNANSAHFFDGGYSYLTRLPEVYR